MGNILSRIQEIAANEGITIGAMERVIGASKGVLSRAINNGTDIQSKWTQTIVENYPIYSTRWLITGVTPMLSQEQRLPICSSKSTDNTISIPLVDICVAAGCSGYDNPNYIEAIESIQMPETMLRHNANIHETYYSKVSELEDKVDVLQNQMGMIIKANNLIK